MLTYYAQYCADGHDGEACSSAVLRRAVLSVNALKIAIHELSDLHSTESKIQKVCTKSLF